MNEPPPFLIEPVIGDIEREFARAKNLSSARSKIAISLSYFLIDPRAARLAFSFSSVQKQVNIAEEFLLFESHKQKGKRDREREKRENDFGQDVCLFCGVVGKNRG